MRAPTSSPQHLRRNRATRALASSRCEADIPTSVRAQAVIATPRLVLVMVS